MSGASNIATVSGAGVVTGLAAGNATITATDAGKSGTSAITVSTVVLPPPTGTCQTGAVAWASTALSAVQTGAFTVSWDATPNGANLDAVTGLGSASVTSWTSMAAIVRFNNTNTIDARKGAAYT